MKHFASLFMRLDQSNKISDKISALEDYFENAIDEDKLWTIALFTHKRPKRQVNTKLLRMWCTEIANVPDWLFEESYHTVGDLAETIALLLPLNAKTQDKSLSYWIKYLMDLENVDEAEKKIKILNAWDMMNKEERFIFTKIITGGFRVGVSQNLITQAVANAYGLEKTEIAHRIMGDWQPDQVTFQELILSKNKSDDLSKPYPFYLAYSVD